MISEWELWACANHLIEKHGESAAIEAEMLADELLAEDNLKGMRTFHAIARRIEQLLEGTSETLH